MPESDNFTDENLLVNVGALKAGVIGWGGYKALLLAAEKGEEDSYSYGAGGVDGSGVGTATSAVTQNKAESGDSYNLSDRDLNSKDIRNGVTLVQWNISALDSRLDNLSDRYNPGVRASQLDKVIRKEAIRSVWGHNINIGRGSRHMAALSMVDGFVATQALTQGVLYGYEAAGIYLAGYAAAKSVFDRAGSRLFNPNTDLKDVIADPLFQSRRPTRAAIASGVLATHKLVAAAEQ